MRAARALFVNARAVLAALAAAALLGACGRDEPAAPAGQPAPPPAPAAPFNVLATTDLRDAQALEGMVEKATGVKLRFQWGGTMESTEAVLSGATKADAAWFANAKYLLSDPQGQARVKLQEKIMLSPITVGVSQSAARATRYAVWSAMTPMLTTSSQKNASAKRYFP